MKIDDQLDELLRSIKDNPSDNFEGGVYYLKHVYDCGFTKIFGQKLGIMIADFILLKGIQYEMKNVRPGVQLGGQSR